MTQQPVETDLAFNPSIRLKRLFWNVELVRNVGDGTRAGELGAVRWAEQLESIGAQVDIYMVPSGDLGDLVEGKSGDEIRELGLTNR